MPVDTSPHPVRSLDPQKAKAPARLSPASSLVLDIIRFLAALTVAVGHFTQTLFSTGLPNLMSAAAAAVGVFFVLSGFIIRYITLLRVSSLADYFYDRAARLFSVVLPALGFTVIADLAARQFGDGAKVPGAGEYVLRLAATLSFTSETWFQDLTPFGNGPFWSLSFEAFYYVLYGVGFYLRGPKRVVYLFAVALLAGPSILLLAPIWFLGCYLLEGYEQLRQSRRRSLLTVALLALAAFAAAAVVVKMPAPYRLAAKAWASQANQQMMAWKLWKVSTWYYESGIPAALVMLGALLLFDRVKIPANSRAVRVMRYIADGTFPLYLFHFPMLRLVRAAVPYDRANRWQLAAILFGVVVICILLGGACNRLKDLLRGLLPKAARPENAAVPLVAR